MKNTKALILGLVFSLLGSISASAQTRQVPLKPVLKPGQENRYVINISVDTRVTPSGANGIASVVRKETTATVLLRGVAGNSGNSSAEVLIEAFNARTTIDGVEAAEPEDSAAGKKIEYDLDEQGRATRVSFPPAAGKAGLAELLLSLARWTPSNEVSVGQSWGQSVAIESLSGDLGYIAAPSIGEIPKKVAVSYRLSSLDGNKAIIDGAIMLDQSGSSSLTTRKGRLNVAGVAEGKGNTRIEYDVAAAQIVSATTETSFEGRLMNMAPTREGEKPQPHEGSIVEKAKFSIKLVQ
jgi:carbon monoxide dehydrogenase subunit G